MQKSFSKILTSIFLLIFIFQLASLIFLLAVPETSQAVDFVPQVGIGDDFEKGKPISMSGSTKNIADYIKAIYKYALGIVGILATVVLMFGGVLWITAGGNAERITNAKSWLTAALTGLVLALTSYMILYFVNPGLVNFRVTPVKNVEDSGSDDKNDERGCCEVSYRTGIGGTGNKMYICTMQANKSACETAAQHAPGTAQMLESFTGGYTCQLPDGFPHDSSCK